MSQRGVTRVRGGDRQPEERPEPVPGSRAAVPPGEPEAADATSDDGGPSPLIILLRLVGIALGAVVLVRVLFTGAAGIESVVAVGVATGLVWLTLRFVRPAAAALRTVQPWIERHVGSRKPVRSVTDRSALAIVLMILILIVQAAFTGYVGVWTILFAIVLGLIATAMSSGWKVIALIAGLAAVFATATVFISDMFRGSTEARALAISLAAVVVPVLVSNRLVQQARRPDGPLRRKHQAVLAVLTLLLGFLGWTRADWLPGVLHGCYTLPTAQGITVLRASADGNRCYGLVDTVDAGVFATGALARDPVTAGLEREILRGNGSAVGSGDLTVVWLGALSCDPLPADTTRCADGRDYPAERDQLRGLLFAQRQAAAEGTHHVHVVIADATQDVAHADDVAQMIIARRAALGNRPVVIGGGDSRDVTQRAINHLLDAGIPFIAPNLLADLGSPGRPFVDRPGFLQLAAPNMEYAKDTVARLGRRYPKGFRLDVYQHPDPTDQYTTSLVNDLFAAATPIGGASARHVSTLDALDDSICASKPAAVPVVLFFADRWTRFADFTQRVNDLCGASAPRLVIADVSVSRFMANYQLRAVSSANWPVDYYTSGPGCAALTEAAYGTFKAQVLALAQPLKVPAAFDCADRTSAGRDGQLLQACSLDAAVKLTSQRCDANDLGMFLIPAYDAVRVADAVVPRKAGTGTQYLASLTLPPMPLSTGVQAVVVQGRLQTPTVGVQLWHVDPLYDPTRIWERPSTRLAAG